MSSADIIINGSDHVRDFVMKLAGQNRNLLKKKATANLLAVALVVLLD